MMSGQECGDEFNSNMVNIVMGRQLALDKSVNIVMNLIVTVMVIV